MMSRTFAPFTKKMTSKPSLVSSRRATPPGMVSMRYLRAVGELRRTKSTPFRGFTWNTGSDLGFAPWAGRALPNAPAPRENNRDNSSLLVIQGPDSSKSAGACSSRRKKSLRARARRPALSFSLRTMNFQCAATVLGSRGRWINVRDVRQGSVDQTVILFELLTLVFFVLLHHRECGRGLGSMHGVYDLGQATQFCRKAAHFGKRGLRTIADTISGLHGVDQ